MKFLITMLLGFSTLFANNLPDQEIGEYTFEWDHQEDFSPAGEMFIESFLYAYSPFSAQELDIQDTKEFLIETINEELELVSENSQHIH